MAAPKNTEVMDALESALHGVCGLTIVDAITDDMALPAVLVQFIQRTRNTFKDSQYEAEFKVRVIVAKQISRVGYRQLASFDDLGSSTSIAAAVEGTLSGAVSSCEITDFQEEDDQAARYGFLGATWTLNVLAKGA